MFDFSSCKANADGVLHPINVALLCKTIYQLAEHGITELVSDAVFGSSIIRISHLRATITYMADAT